MELNFRRAQLEDKALISQYFRQYPSRSCERTFANVYLWAKHYQVEFAIVEDTLVFKSENPERGVAFTFPAGSEEQVIKALDVLEQFSKEKGNPLCLYCVTPEQFQWLEAHKPGTFQITYDEAAADYVYESEKLATLSGKKLHAKRNHINKFMAVYENRWSYEEMTEDNVEECFQMALTWRNQNGCEEDREKNAEMCVTLNSLRLFRELDLLGGILRIDGQIVAFTMGEPVCEDTFVVHIEKAYADIQGAYPMINQQFVKHACLDYKYVNREEDVGEEGLRKAKRSYRPVFMVEKGIVMRKEC